jgi:phosphoribosylamine--glycine ligase
MKVLVIGGGGREHALVWKLRQSPTVEKLWCAPGNGGISQHAECVAVDVADVAALVALGERLRPDLSVVGPELPLVNGVVDEFTKRGLRIVGPTTRAAELEGSKIFAKDFMERHAIPTAKTYGMYDSPSDAYAGLCAMEWPIVIKADGLCAGKGVLVAPDPDDAPAFIHRLMEKREFGKAGARVVIEECLQGEELTYIVLTDGKTILPMVPTQDHKRVFDGNQGPNTGGMGAYSCDDLLSPELEKQIRERIVEPTIEGMAKEGRYYRGFLYFGLMLTATGPKVLEFNCRMGDPEGQAVVMQMGFDLAEALLAATEDRLDRIKPAWKPGASVCVVMASAGYPGEFEKGKKIVGLENVVEGPDITVFHAGTRREGNEYFTSGGRVLGATARADDLASAIQHAYDICSVVAFDKCHFRTDIAMKGLGRAAATGR